jgi:hypothetical protein
MIFKDNSDVLYSDNCCHLNKKGYDIIANEICNIILKDL